MPAAKIIPISLTTLRLLLAPLSICIAYGHWPPWLFLIVLPVATVSDIYDGIIARRLGVDTPRLRRFDTAVDVVFYGCILWAIWVLREPLVRRCAWGIAALLMMEAICNGISLVRFGTLPAIHSYLAKAWGILLCICCAIVLGIGAGAAALVWVTLAVGILVDVEGAIILLLASQPPVDVPSVFVLRRRQASAPRP